MVYPGLYSREDYPGPVPPPPCTTPGTPPCHAVTTVSGNGRHVWAGLSFPGRGRTTLGRAVLPEEEKDHSGQGSMYTRRRRSTLGRVV